MKSIRASIRYAKALLDLSREKGTMDDVKRDSDLLLLVIDENRDFRNFLKSAIIKPDQKIQTFKAALGNQLSEITNLFINLLIKHGREAPVVENPMIIGDWPYYLIGFILFGTAHYLVLTGIFWRSIIRGEKI